MIEVCSRLDMHPSVPEIVMYEVINFRREKVRKYCADLRVAYQGLNGYVRMPDLYIPDEDEAADEMERALRASFEILPLREDLAAESLRREALRILPARKGVGARDSSMWLTICDLLESGHYVYFISNNSADFGKKSLHDSLANEISAHQENFEYFSQPNDFLISKAEKITDLPLVEEHATSAFQESFLKQLPDLLMDRFEDSAQVLAFCDEAVVSIASARFSQGFNVGSTGVAHCAGRFVISNSSDESIEFDFTFQGAVVFDLATYKVFPADAELIAEAL